MANNNDIFSRRRQFSANTPLPESVGQNGYHISPIKQILYGCFLPIIENWQFCDLREEYSGAITLSTTLSQPFSFYAQTIYVVTSVIPWSSPLGGNRKF